MAQKTSSTRTDEDQVLALVREKIDTFVKWDLVRFFHDNPYTINTAENIARVAARDPRTVETQLQELVNSGILESSIANSAHLYRLAKDQAVRDQIASFVLACDDRDFRIRAINLVIEGLQ